MSIIQTNAVLLKKQEIRRTSLLLDFYTEESGKIKGVVKGVRSPQPQFGSLFEVFSLDRIVFYERRNKDIFIISQCELVDYFQDIRKDIERIGYACYFTELIDSTVGPGEKNKDIFKLLLDSLRMLSSQASPKRVTRVFELRLLKYLGIMPRLKSCINCASDISIGNARFSIKGGGMLCSSCFKIDTRAKAILRGTLNFIDKVMESDMDKISRIKVSREVGRDLEQILDRFLGFHIDRRFKSIKFMREVGVL